MIYLDNGATSFPKPKGMIEAMYTCMSTYCGNPGRSGHDMSQRTGEEVYNARKNLAAFLRVENPERIIFTANTTEALNLGIKGVLQQGDHVITTMMEHNSVLRPLKALEENGISFTVIPCNRDGTLDVSLVEAAVQENTKLVICTQASNVTGTIMPIEELSEMTARRGILFMVDGAQSAGHMEVDARKTDLLAVPGHKGLLGPLGTGALYVAEGIELKGFIHGGTGTASREIVQPWEFPDGYESGTVNAPGIIGLGYSVSFVNRIGASVIEAYERRLIEPIDEALRNMAKVQVYGPEDCKKKVGIVTFNIQGLGCEETARRLNDDYGIAVRGGYHCAGLAHKAIGTWDRGAVRISAGPFNTSRQIKTAIEAVYQIAKSAPDLSQD